MLGSFYRTFSPKCACFGFIKKFQVLFEKIDETCREKHNFFGLEMMFFALFIKVEVGYTAQNGQNFENSLSGAKK